MNSQEKKVLLSGMKPNRHLHLGNYLGALKNWVDLQSQYECYFMAVDLHSVTVREDPKELYESTYTLLATYIAAGIDPDRCTLFVQSHVAEHAALAWVLTCNSTMGELNRMTQFKDKSAKQEKVIPTGLFTYPILMAADILLYQTHLVPVGQDQKQHLELTRDLAGRMNSHYKEKLFTVPNPYIAKVGARIMDLQDPQSKMGKTDSGASGAVFLTDTDDQIIKKIKRATTDSGTEITGQEDQLGVKNLLEIQTALTGKTAQELVKAYQGKQYGHLKVDTGDIVVEFLRPVREKINELMKDRSYLDALMKKGADKARDVAAQTLAKVYQAIGFVK